MKFHQLRLKADSYYRKYFPCLVFPTDSSLSRLLRTFLSNADPLQSSKKVWSNRDWSSIARKRLKWHVDLHFMNKLVMGILSGWKGSDFLIGLFFRDQTVSPKHFPTCFPEQYEKLPEEEYAPNVHRFEDPSIVFEPEEVAKKKKK